MKLLEMKKADLKAMLEKTRVKLNDARAEMKSPTAYIQRSAISGAAAYGSTRLSAAYGGEQGARIMGMPAEPIAAGAIYAGALLAGPSDTVVNVALPIADGIAQGYVSRIGWKHGLEQRARKVQQLAANQSAQQLAASNVVQLPAPAQMPQVASPLEQQMAFLMEQVSRQGEVLAQLSSLASQLGAPIAQPQVVTIPPGHANGHTNGHTNGTALPVSHAA